MYNVRRTCCKRCAFGSNHILGHRSFYGDLGHLVAARGEKVELGSFCF
jgi:hypothetical protein